jgi:hypothetical protein
MLSGLSHDSCVLALCIYIVKDANKATVIPPDAHLGVVLICDSDPSMSPLTNTISNDFTLRGEQTVPE